mmetsp:Transcript_98184/g.281042  ORF Transcript_98184/g.281042 Transcript_98184/m.281042 type:complete len:99 (+) Transcript_98184:61-357(+)
MGVQVQPARSASASVADDWERGTEWTAHYDDEGRIYYANVNSGETSWGEYDTTTWDQHEHDGRAYWYNRVTKRTSWSDPSMRLAADEALAEADAGQLL